jgi:hypothetical protein
MIPVRAAAAVLAGLVACRGGGVGPAAPDESDDVFPVTIVVRDSISNDFLPGAIVLAGARQGITDETGRVTLTVPRGPVIVAAYVAGYDPVSMEVPEVGTAALAIGLRPAAPRVSSCGLRGSLLEAVATDFAGRKTILRRARSEVTLEGPEFGSVVVPVIEWTWKAIDTWSYQVTVPRPGEVTRATWRVLDDALNVEPVVCDPRTPSGTR